MRFTPQNSVDDRYESMESDGKCFFTSSRQQALDWALVLMSQSIHSWVFQSHSDTDIGQEALCADYGSPHQVWGVCVQFSDSEQARQAIWLYENENPCSAGVDEAGLTSRGREFRIENYFRASSSVLWVSSLAIFFWLQRNAAVDVESLGKLDSERVWAGEWTRLFTAPFLHADLDHFASNAGLGFLWAGLAMARFGDGWVLFGLWACGVMGNLLGIMVYPDPYTGLGASGSVFGALGMLTGQACIFSGNTVKDRSEALNADPVHNSRLIGGFRRFWGLKQLRAPLAALSGGALMFSLFGMNPESDWIAHLGGFGFGVVLGAVGGYVIESTQSSEAKTLGGWALWLASVVWIWQLALSTGK